MNKTLKIIIATIFILLIIAVAAVFIKLNFTNSDLLIQSESGIETPVDNHSNPETYPNTLNNKKSFLKITSPNGGESYKPGDVLTIEWDKENVPHKKPSRIRVTNYIDNNDYNAVTLELNCLWSGEDNIKWEIPEKIEANSAMCGEIVNGKIDFTETNRLLIYIDYDHPNDPNIAPLASGTLDDFFYISQKHIDGHFWKEFTDVNVAKFMALSNMGLIWDEGESATYIPHVEKMFLGAAAGAGNQETSMVFYRVYPNYNYNLQDVISEIPVEFLMGVTLDSGVTGYEVSDNEGGSKRTYLLNNPENEDPGFIIVYLTDTSKNKDGQVMLNSIVFK